MSETDEKAYSELLVARDKRKAALRRRVKRGAERLLFKTWMRGACAVFASCCWATAYVLVFPFWLAIRRVLQAVERIRQRIVPEKSVFEHE